MVAEYTTNILIEDDDWDGAGIEGGHVSLVESAPLTQRIRLLITKFVEWGADARGYHDEVDQLVTLDEDLNAVATVSFHGEHRYYVPHAELPFREATLFETRELKHTAYAPYDAMTSYSYYQIDSDGKITPLQTHRLFSFTKFVKISKDNFTGEFKNFIDLPADHQRLPGHGCYILTNHLTLEDLDVMRNEIFAEYGYRFTSEKWHTHFSQQPWYTPQYDNVDDMLTDMDRHNVQFIHNFQKKMRGHESEYIQRDSVYYMAAG